MKLIVKNPRRKPVKVLGGWRCPNCKGMLAIRQRTVFGFDLVCPKGDFIAGVCE